ncbi:MAG: asparagine synthetase B [Gammaproteobacteria bacterium]|nr:asparagine synthetase B [Gammaproteobacteria bacterium]NIR22549.1 asparagine synthetase B [Gammaproteobacteria bacterium]NIS04121.1 asparagine synthetase B [Gammaproteobacteria bacterium]NIU42173.1 asparagine synthetase B [Gammaproteobacteria bacterium]NIV46136.1 asparagine synthetase B [Gammaproteobacteria bacterium]
MSGIVGIVSLDGRPIDRRLLDRLTGALHFRGGDAEDTWVGGGVGFGHAMLRTTLESRDERQPCSLDDRVWIVADARVDGRSELCGKLRCAGRDIAKRASDPELILHAYHAWGESCVQHLMGDFAFAIWDARRGRLFCARDHFGVKPFFYAHSHGSVVFSNTLECVRELPRVRDTLDDVAIADLLLFGVYQDAAATAFADIRRLAPAHCMSWSGDALRVRRYWQLPPGGERRAPREAECIDAFMERFNAAVADRLRAERVGVLMSGGLDSTSVACVARSLLGGGQGSGLRAYTCVSEHRSEDEERHFSRLAADALGIPIRYTLAKDEVLLAKWRRGEPERPEPAIEPLAGLFREQATEVASHCRVALSGWDGDALLNESPRSRLAILARGARLTRRAAAIAWRALRGGGAVRPGAGQMPFAGPAWLSPALVERLDLHGRWQAVQSSSGTRRDKRPRVHRQLTSPLLATLLESYDPGVTRIPLEVRHPFLDLRVVEFLVSLPAAPWCIDKRLLRTAMRDRLPEPIRQRPKTPLAWDPVMALLQRSDARWVDEFEAAPAFGRYVDRAALPPLAGARDPDRLWIDIRPLCLNAWLQSLAGANQSFSEEDYHEVA